MPREEGAGTIVGEVVHVDHYGNLISNIPADLVDPAMTFTVAIHALGVLCRTFADVAVGRPLAYIGSGGTVEIAVRDGSAASLLGTGIGAEVRGHPAS